MSGVDRGMIEALRRGDDRAFTAVVDLLLGPVYRFLLRLSGSPGVAEDLAQETFLAVWQSIGTFSGKSQVKTWVFGIAYHQFLRYRQKPRVETVQFNEARHERKTANPDALLLEADERRRVRQAIYALPGPCRGAELPGSRSDPRRPHRHCQVADECRFQAPAREARGKGGARR